MKDRGGQYRTRAALGDAFDQMIKRAHTARGDHGNIHGIRNRTGQGQVEAGLGPVAVHRGQQDLTCALRGGSPRECDSINARGFTPAVGENLPAARRDGLGVDRADDALAAKVIGRFGQNLGACDSRGVETDLVGTCQKQIAHVRHSAYTAPDRERDITLLSRALDHIKHGAAVLMSGVNIEKTQLVRTRRIIGPRAFHRITCIAQPHEIDAFDNTAIGHIKTRNDPRFQHGQIFAENLRPCKAAKDFSQKNLMPPTPQAPP